MRIEGLKSCGEEPPDDHVTAESVLHKQRAPGKAPTPLMIAV